MPPPSIRILLNPTITPDQLFAFYEKNDICERGFGKEVAARVLDHSDVIVGASGGEGGGVGKAAAQMLIREPFAMGATFVSTQCWPEIEDVEHLRELGFTVNEGSVGTSSTAGRM